MACSAMSSGAGVEYVEPDGFRIEKVRDLKRNTSPLDVHV